jgi:hypothetical protein
MESKSKNYDKTAHLSFIEDAINRMGSNSFQMKGWLIALLAGSFVLFSVTNLISKILWWLFGICVFVVLIFQAFDMYYLSLEKRFRLLYDSVASSDEEFSNYSMDIRSYRNEKTGFHACLKSFSIWPFYLSLLVILTLIFVLLYFGVTLTTSATGFSSIS